MNKWLRLVVSLLCMLCCALGIATTNWVTNFSLNTGSVTSGSTSTDNMRSPGDTLQIAPADVNGVKTVEFEVDLDTLNADISNGLRVTVGADVFLIAGSRDSTVDQRVYAWNVNTSVWDQISTHWGDSVVGSAGFLDIPAGDLSKYLDGTTVHLYFKGWKATASGMTAYVDFFALGNSVLSNLVVTQGGASTGGIPELSVPDGSKYTIESAYGSAPGFTGLGQVWQAGFSVVAAAPGLDLSFGAHVGVEIAASGGVSPKYKLFALNRVTGLWEGMFGNPIDLSASLTEWVSYVAPADIGKYFNSNSEIQVLVYTHSTASSGGSGHQVQVDHLSISGSKLPPKPVFADALPSWAEGARFSDRVQSGGNGPSSADSVEPSTGVFVHSPNPDIRAFNPETRPDVALARMYSTRLAVDGVKSPGFPVGWTHSYDFTIASSSPGTWSDMELWSPSGAKEVFAPNLDGFGNPTGSFDFLLSGRPYKLSGTASGTTGVWTDLTLLHRDGTEWTFTETPASSGVYRLTQIEAVSGTPIVLSYDSFGRLTVATCAGTNLLSLSYGSNGFISEAGTWLGKEVRFGYDYLAGHECLTEVSTVVGSAQSVAPTRWAYSYSWLGGKPYMTSVSAPNASSGSGLATHPVYYDNETGKATNLSDANGNERLYDYQAGQTEVIVKDSLGAVDANWTESFDANGLTIGVTDAFNQSASFSYGDPGNPYKVTSVVDRNGQVTLFGYDLNGNLSTVVERPGTSRELITTYVFSTSINPNGLLTEVQEGSNLLIPKTSTQFVYDGAGRIKQVWTPIPGQSGSGQRQISKEYFYTFKGNIDKVSVLGPNGVFLDYDFDYASGGSEIQGRPYTVTNPLGGVQSYSYNADGTLATTTSTLVDTGQAEYRTTEFMYDDAGRITDVIHPSKANGSVAGSTDQLNYTEAGDLVEVKHYNELGGLMRSVNSARGLEAEVTGTSGNTVGSTVAKDAVYRPVAHTNGNSQVTQAVYDAAGNLDKVQSPLGNGDTVTLRDHEGNPTQIVKRGGVIINIVRATDDARITQINANGSLAVIYNYDVFNRITSIVDTSGTTTYAYDDLDNTTSVNYAYTGVPAQTVSYEYRVDGSRGRMYVPTTGTGWTKNYFDYSYYADGQLWFISPPWRAGSAIDYIYRQDGSIKQQRNAHLRTIVNYNGRGLVSSVTNLSRSTTLNLLYSRFVLTYDDYGNLAENDATVTAAGSATDVSSNTVYQYETNGLLKRETKTFDNPAQGFYDFIYQSDASGYYISARNVPLTRDAEGKVAQSGWVFANGNTTANNGLSGMLYDDYGRTLQVKDFSGSTTLLTNTWRGDGLRASRSATNGTIYYIYDGDLPIMEVQPNGTVETGYAYGLLGLVEEWDKSRNDEQSISWDPHGNPVSRHRTTTPFDINVYDVWGKLYSSTLASGGTPAQLDSVGGGSQWGMLVDQQTVSTNTALGMVSGKYFDPVSGRNLTYEDRFGNYYVDDGGAEATLYWFEAAKYVPLVGAGVFAMEAAYEYQQGNYSDAAWNVAGAALEIIPVASEAVATIRTVNKLDDGLKVITIASGSGSDVRNATYVRRLKHGESTSALIRELKERTWNGGVEHAIVSMQNGSRWIVKGGAHGIHLPDRTRRLIAHTHPYHLPSQGPSIADRLALGSLGQRSSYLLERGILEKFRP